MEWQPIETAPRDGTWIIVEGEVRGGDTSSVAVARWNPTFFRDLGVYEWETIDTDNLYFGTFPARDLFNYFGRGRVHQWMPLPGPPEYEGQREIMTKPTPDESLLKSADSLAAKMQDLSVALSDLAADLIAFIVLADKIKNAGSTGQAPHRKSAGEDDHEIH